MRGVAIFVAALVAFGGLAGCIGGKDETNGENLNETGTPGTGSVPGTGTLAGKDITVLAALDSTLTLDAPAWVQSGTDVPVSLSAPSKAKGAITYAWAIGALPGTTTVDPVVKPDTGSAKTSDWIQPGASKSLTYSTPGTYLMHCHPHPAMLHNVTVIDGFEGPKTVEVLITDGEGPTSFRFVPENIVIGTNTTVTYTNVGKQAHTATAMGEQQPALTLLPLKADSGNITVAGEGWQRIVAIFHDSEGRLGMVEQPIYVTSELPSFEAQSFTFEFTYGAAPLAGTPAEAAADSKPVTLEQPGLVTLNYTFTDAAAAAQNMAQVEIHFTKDGETQDTLTSEPTAEGSLSGKAQPGAYTLKVIPKQGVEITGTITVEVLYELVPPEPAMETAETDDHGGGAHHH